MSTRVTIVTVALAFLVACGDNQPLCPAEEAAASVTTSALCMSAHELARRATTELNPTQSEIDQAASLVASASKPLELILARIPAAGPWEGPLATIGGEATDPAIAQAWRAGRLHTGVEQVDRILAAANITRVQWTEDRFVTLGSDRKSVV